MAKNIPNMNACRYDIRLKNIADLEHEYFKILEINGTMGMAYLGYSWYIEFIMDMEWHLTRLIIGLYNILTLQGYSPINLLYVMYKSYITSIKCKNWDNLYSLYS